MSILKNLCRVLCVLWAGSLWSLALWVAPTLFFAQHDRHLAGALVARLFSIETYLGLAVLTLAVLLPGRTKFLWAYAAVALLALNEWLLKPLMASAQTHGSFAGLTFAAWHGVSAILYLIACLGALLLIWKNDLR